MVDDFDDGYYENVEVPRMEAIGADEPRFNECVCGDAPSWIYAVCCLCGSQEWGCNHLGHACHPCFMRDIEARHEQHIAERRDEDQSSGTA